MVGCKYLYISFLVVVLNISSILSPIGYAQLPTMPSEREKPEWSKDPLQRRTPRGVVSGFVQAVAEGNYERAARYLDTEGLDNSSMDGPELARTLQQLVDQQGNIIARSLISNQYEGRTGDNLPSNLDQIGFIESDDEQLPIYLQQKQDSTGAPIWLFSSETLQALSEITETTSSLRVNQYLPDFLLNNNWWGVPVGHWLVMLLYIGLSYPVAWLLVALGVKAMQFLWRKVRYKRAFTILQAFVLPTRIFVAVWIFILLRRNTGISLVARQSFSEVTSIVGMVAFLMLLWRLVDVFTRFGEEWLIRHGNQGGLSAVLFLRRSIKLIFVALGIIFFLDSFGVDVTTGLAALGIGGLALALGAQKTIENLVGSLTLITDQPIRVGDFCKIEGQVGTIEQIGMRSTRIRTLDRTVVFIPNGQLAALKIENYAYRERFWFHPTIALRYETTPDQIRYLLVELRAMLYAHPRVDPNPARVRFTGLGADSLPIEIFSYVHARDYDDFLEVQEDLTLRIMDIVAESGTGFAFPSQTIYMAKDSGLSKEKTEEAEEKVQTWREQDEMQLPKFDQDRINELRDTIDYPPPGSSAYRNNGKSS